MNLKRPLITSTGVISGRFSYRMNVGMGKETFHLELGVHNFLPVYELTIFHLFLELPKNSFPTFYSSSGNT